MNDLTKQQYLDLFNNKYSEFKKFIENNNGTYFKQSASNFIVADEVDFKGKQFLIEYDTVNNKLLFTDDMVCMERAYNINKDINLDKWNDELNKLIENVKSLGYILRSKCIGGNDDYLWYELVIDIKDFNLDTFESAVRWWNNYNVMFRSDLYAD